MTSRNAAEQRLMRYATAIARDDIDHILGPGFPLPEADYGFWERWKRTASVVLKLADEEHPPPPGGTEEQLPAEILMLTVQRRYVSTACDTAHALEGAMTRYPEHHTELGLWRDRMHSRCRLNNKFTGVLCACPHHTEG